MTYRAPRTTHQTPEAPVRAGKGPRIASEAPGHTRTRGTTPTPPPVVTPDRLEVWVPGKLVNPLNAREHHFRKAQRVARERQATSHAIWLALQGGRVEGAQWRVTDPAAPKIITFTLHTSRDWDDDALAAGVKAHRDELITAGIVNGDAKADGHTFRYAQVVTRAWAGVQIAVVRA